MWRDGCRAGSAGRDCISAFFVYQKLRRPKEKKRVPGWRSLEHKGNFGAAVGCRVVMVYNERRLCPHITLPGLFWVALDRGDKLNHSAGGLADVYKISDFCFATVIFACTD